MEDWEIKLREKLENEVSNGLYNIGEGTGMTCYTGKDGYINFIVELHREIKKRYK
jgi:hypothetical protein